MARRMRSSSAAIVIGVGAGLDGRAGPPGHVRRWRRRGRTPRARGRPSAATRRRLGRDERLLHGLDDVLEAHLGRRSSRADLRRAARRMRGSVATCLDPPPPRPPGARPHRAEAGRAAADPRQHGQRRRRRRTRRSPPRPRRRPDDHDARRAAGRAQGLDAVRQQLQRGERAAGHDDRVAGRPWRTAAPASGSTAGRRRRATPARRRRR